MINLSKEKETLLIPLYGKAMDAQDKSSILSDQKALEIISTIDYPFDSLRIDQKTNTMLTLRARLIDDYVHTYLDHNKQTDVLHLGCGLDSRVERVGNKGNSWYEVDFKEVIDLRKGFYQESESVRFIASSVTDDRWFDELVCGKDHGLVIAEGLFMYLSEEEISHLLVQLKKTLGSYRLVFDAYSKMTAKHATNHPSLKRTGAVIKWGIDKPQSLENICSNAKYLETLYLTDNPYVSNLSRVTRMSYGIANRFKMAKEAHRVLIYEIS